jgi:hypothetical protein
LPYLLNLAEHARSAEVDRVGEHGAVGPEDIDEDRPVGLLVEVSGTAHPEVVLDVPPQYAADFRGRSVVALVVVVGFVVVVIVFAVVSATKFAVGKAQ